MQSPFGPKVYPKPKAFLVQEEMEEEEEEVFITNRQLERQEQRYIYRLLEFIRCCYV